MFKTKVTEEKFKGLTDYTTKSFEEIDNTIGQVRLVETGEMTDCNLFFPNRKTRIVSIMEIINAMETYLGIEFVGSGKIEYKKAKKVKGKK